MQPEKNPLTPRETAMRMLEHMPDDASYGDIIRQLRVLEDIENTLNDVDMAGFPADDAVEEARSTLDASVEEGGPALDVPAASISLQSGSEWERIGDAPAGDSLLRNARWVT